MVKKNVLLVLLTLAAIPSVLAQTSVGVYISPDINRGRNYFNEGPINSFGVSLGLNAQTSLSEHFSLLYGIQYAPKRFDSSGYRSSVIIAGRSALTDVTSVKSRHQLIEVPLQVRYGFMGRDAKLVPYLQVGVVGSRLMSIENEYATENGESFKAEPAISSSARNNLSGELGAGVAYRLSQQLELNIQPTVRMEFDSPLFFSRLGLGITLFYKF